MRRPAPKSERKKLTAEQRRELAADASYVGSGEHKASGWWGGLPASKQLPGGKVGRRKKQITTVCPLTTEQDRHRATEWVRGAITAGQYKFFPADKRFPKKVWFKADGQIWYGFCTNSELGQYKGWPIDEEERSEIFD